MRKRSQPVVMFRWSLNEEGTNVVRAVYEKGNLGSKVERNAEIIRRVINGDTLRHTADEFNVSTECVRHIVRRFVARSVRHLNGNTHQNNVSLGFTALCRKYKGLIERALRHYLKHHETLAMETYK